MKKIYILFVLLFLIFEQVTPKEISSDLAIKKATEILQTGDANTQLTVKNIQLVKTEGVSAYYILNFSPEGWALISANDVTKPVIAYSKQGYYLNQDQPESVRSWMKSYEDDIVNAVKFSDKVHSEWQTTETAPQRVIGSSNYTKVDPLIKVNFNQGRPYNTYCPSDNDGTALVGCVAVAMAQAMTVARFPDRPNGSYSYFHNKYGNIYINYDAEEPYNWNLIISGSDGRLEAARLLYHCGVSVKMDYGISGSGTQTSYIPNALKTYYSYPPSAKVYARNDYKGNWEELVLNELSGGRAVVYSGNNGGVGHAFNLDGYDGNNMYHVNWGWGGQNNGYYTIDGMKDGNQVYTQNQQIVTGIRPPSEAPSNILLSNMSVEEGKEVGTVVADVIVESEAVDPIYAFELKGFYSVIFHRHMPAPFYIEDGKLKTKEVFNAEDGDQTVIIKATNTQNGLWYEREFLIDVTQKASSVKNTFAIEPVVFVKSNNSISVSAKENLQYELFTTLGTKLSSGTLNIGENTISIDNVKSPIVILKLSNNASFGTYKLMINK